MAILACVGHVQPSEYRAMEYRDAARLADKVVDLHRRQRESRDEYLLVLTKGLMRAMGARIT